MTETASGATAVLICISCCIILASAAVIDRDVFASRMRVVTFVHVVISDAVSVLPITRGTNGVRGKGVIRIRSAQSTASPLDGIA